MGKGPPGAGPLLWPPSLHHVTDFPGGKQRNPHAPGLKRFHMPSAQTEPSVSRNCLALTSPPERLPSQPRRQAVNCGSDCYTLMYYGAEAWGFCLKKNNKSLHFLSALVMLVSEDLYFPGSPEQHRQGDSWEGPDLTAGTRHRCVVCKHGQPTSTRATHMMNVRCF